MPKMHQRSASAYPMTNSAGYLSEVRMLKILSGYNVTILIGLRNECFPIKDDDDDDRVFCVILVTVRCSHGWVGPK